MTPKKGHASWREWLKSSITSDRVMAAFTVVIAFVAVLQWRVFAAQRDVFAAQLDEMRIDQRAWLAVKPNLIQPQINSPVVAPTVVTNTGKTPAKNIHGWVFVQRVPKNTAIDFSNPTYTEPPKVEQGEPIPVNIKFNIGVLFPNDPTSLNEVAMRRQDAVGSPFVEIIWTQTMQEQYDRGEFYLNVRARFTYDDAAGKAHWTQFCRIATAPGQAASVPNHTSEQCMAWTTIDDNK